MKGLATVQVLRAAEFREKEVQEWSARQYKILLAAGFSEEEVQAHFGAPPVDDTPMREHMRSTLDILWKEKPESELTFGQAFEAGWQQSVAGLMARERAPDLSVGEDAPAANRIASQVGTLAGDFPAMVAGALVTTVGTGGAGLPMALGGAFALPAALRTMLMEKYENGEIDSFERFWDVLSASWIAEFKGFGTGVATGGAGLAGRAGGTALRTAIPSLPGATPTVTATAAEIATMVSVGSALEGEVPEPQDFLDAAIVIGGAKGAIGTARRLRTVYARTGRRPADVVKDNEVDPTIVEDLHSINQEVPRAYKSADEVREILQAARERGEGIPEAIQKIRKRRAERPAERPPEPAPPAGPPPSAPVDAVLERISVGGKGPRKGFSLSQFYTDWFDRLHPLQKVVEAMAEGKELSVVEDAYKLARLHVGVSGKAQHFLEYSPFKFGTFERVGRPLKVILDPVQESPDAFRAYLVSRRALELAEREIETGVPFEEARAVVAEHRGTFEPIRRELLEYQDHVLAYIRDAGLLSEEAMAAMREANADYVPFFREHEGAPLGGAGKGLKTRDPIKRIKGSERRIVDPLESIIKNTYLFIALAERNEIAGALVKLAETSERGAEFAKKSKRGTRRVQVSDREIKNWLDQQRGGEGVEPGEPPTVFRAGAFVPSKNQIAYYRNGAREVWDVDPKIAEVFNGMDAQQASILTRFLSVPARFLRAGAIWAPEFIARNPMRDQLTAFAYSAAGLRPFVDFSYGIFHLAKKDSVYQDWLRSGGPQATMVSLDRRYLQKGIRQILNQTTIRDTARNIVKSPIEMLAVISEIAEQGTRIGEFGRATRKGAQGKEEILGGGLASREITLDFGRIGARAQAMNSITAFFNAQVQGVDKMVRAFRDHPTRTSAKVVGSITIPSVILYLLNRDEEGFDEIPRWQKDLFWLFPVDYESGRVWHRVPKPFELGIIFGSGAERIAEFILEQDPDAFNEFLGAVVRGATPSVIPTAILPVVESYFNRSIFLDRPIIPQNRERWLTEYQANPYTTELTRFVGRTIASIPGMKRSKLASPAIIDNYVRAWTGGLGQHALKLADKALRETGLLPDPPVPSDTLADLPLIKGFTVRYPSGGAQSIQDFYEGYAEQEEVLTTIKGLMKEGDVDSAMRELKIRQGNLVDLGEIRESLSNTTHFIRLLHRIPGIPPEEKRQIIDSLYLTMIETAKVGNQMLDVSREMAESQAAIPMSGGIQ